MKHLNLPFLELLLANYILLIIFYSKNKFGTVETIRAISKNLINNQPQPGAWPEGIVL